MRRVCLAIALLAAGSAGAHADIGVAQKACLDEYRQAASAEAALIMVDGEVDRAADTNWNVLDRVIAEMEAGGGIDQFCTLDRVGRIEKLAAAARTQLQALKRKLDERKRTAAQADAAADLPELDKLLAASPEN